ncbi:Mini-ribonuclease 3 [Petrocella sp. FN5]|uniref:Mini-ribonuclease 3 n=1 Tax=Petrocella sp. FN5 TaxID=3032002 RepID=UPI0023DC7F17|nr:ribonuclease III domain-containing protein [Petrocella sp. FN5]MDF1616678.1 ribonuclease III domain-containing protein [Petrocella sp. FN5]
MNVVNDFLTFLEKELSLDEMKVHTYSPLALAYIGDSIYDLIIRTYIISKGSKAVGKMHKEASIYVNAKTQAKIYHTIKDTLTDEEMSVMKRGRNAKSGSKPKNTDLITYKHATGFETLIGYLYVTKQLERLVALIATGLKTTQLTQSNNISETIENEMPYID